jgi:O-methyltransferase
MPDLLRATAWGTGRMAKAASEASVILRASKIYRRYRDFTMVWPMPFVANLALCKRKAPSTGCIIECGVWRGGMSAGIADILPGRRHFLFDSFEGLPPAREIDGEAAIAFQRNKNSPAYYDNCRAEPSFAEKAMSMSAAGSYVLVPGWFDDTIPAFVPPEPIAVLRLDGDWYDSTLRCLLGLYPHLAPSGLVIIDDYNTCDGCARAVHDYLSKQQVAARIRERYGVSYIMKDSN